MSQVKLDLKGIDVARFVRQPRQVNSRKFEITAQEPATECRIPAKCIFLTLFLLVMALCFFSFSGSSTIVRTTPKQLAPALRKIIRMRCVHDTSTHCTTENDDGEYVVNAKGCSDVFEFNGIPFTDVYVDNSGNFHIPPSSSHNMVVQGACKTLTATYDTNIKYKPDYAKKNAEGTKLERVVWIPASNCYTEYTLIIDKEKILDNTPTAMLESHTLHNHTAYIYEVHGDIQGSVLVQGTGCSVPINIYTLRSR